MADGKRFIVNFIVILMEIELNLVKENDLGKSKERLTKKIKIQDNFKFVDAYS